MTSRGFLWVGTSVGIVLTFSLPRLKDGVPRIWDKPWVSCHSHNGPIRFLLPIYCDTVNVWQGIGNSPSRVATKSGNLNVTSPRAVGCETESDIVLRNPDRKASPVNVDKSDMNLDLNVSRTSTAKVLPVEVDDEITTPEKSMSLSRKTSDQYSPLLFNRKSADIPGFHDELSKKLKNQNRGLRGSLPNLLDIDRDEDEISMYYGELMTFKGGLDALKVSESIKTIPSDDIKSKDKDNSESGEKVSDKSLKNNRKLSLSKKSESFSEQSKNSGCQIKPTLSLRGPPKDGARPKALDTMGKRSCNAVIVVCGGDGYVDWRKITERQGIKRNDEASLMMWMYKY